MGAPPLVSAIVAAYNYGHFLPRTLDSALAQDYPADRLEIIVVDDGSTDDTPAVLADYTRRHPGRIRAFRQDNAGYVAATNRAFAEARGDYWALLDADDLWPPGKTARQVEIFEQRPEVGAVYGDLEIIDPDGRIVHPSHWGDVGLQPARGPGVLSRLLVDGNVATASSIMLRAALADLFAPVPDGPRYVDWWVVMQVATVAELEYLLEPRVGYREHGGNLTLGAEGFVLARERIKQATTRRAMLVHGGAACLSAEALLPAWNAVEHDVLQAVQAAGTAFLTLPPVSATDRAAGAVAGRRAAALQARGRFVEALRCRVVAAALDPFDEYARGAVRDLAQALGLGIEAGGHPFDGARSAVVLAGADELAAEPALLAAYARAVDADDDVTLVIHAPGWGADKIEPRLLDVLGAAGLGPDGGPDLLALTDTDTRLGRAGLARGADALLTAEDGASAGGAPAYGVADVDALRERIAQVLGLVRPRPARRPAPTPR